jgi:hypothetical protein
MISKSHGHIFVAYTFLPVDPFTSLLVNLFWSVPPWASPPWPSIFSDYSFWVHHCINWDDHHLLAHAKASDFSVTLQCLSKRTIGFLITDHTLCPYPTRSLPAQFWHWCMEWSTVWVSSKPLITEEILAWPSLEPGLPNWHTGALSTTPWACWLIFCFFLGGQPWKPGLLPLATDATISDFSVACQYSLQEQLFFC